MTDEDVTTIGLVMANIDRLIEDATLMITNGRLPSAYVLNIALEEVGKIIHMRWRHLGRATTRQDRTSHLQKQWAVACLLIADKLLPFYRDILSGRPEDQQHHMERMALAFMDSSERKFFESVIAKNLDRAKQLGLYEDGGEARIGQDRDALNHDAILEVSGTTLRAVPLIKSEPTLLVASIFYEIMPPLKDAILAEVAGR